MKVKYKEAGCREHSLETTSAEFVLFFSQSVNKMKAGNVNSGATLGHNHCVNQCNNQCEHVASVCKIKLSAVAVVRMHDVQVICGTSLALGLRSPVFDFAWSPWENTH